MFSGKNIAWLVWMACSAPLAFAQTTGAIEGTVRDPSGLVLANCEVQLREATTGAVRILKSSGDGVYLAPSLPPGTYRVEITHAGFRTEVRTDVEVLAGHTQRADFRLVIGETRETVTVNDQPVLVSTASSEWGGSIQQSQLAALPLKGRDIFDLVAQQPGVTVPTNVARTSINGFGAAFSVNGGRPQQNSYRVDGLFINEASGGAPSSASGQLLGLESLQEVHLISSPFSAEYGRTSGGAFTAVSRSGTNTFHGSLYEFLRNNDFDSKNFFDSKTEPIPVLRKNQFGGLIGGPIRRNRLFVLANYEGVRSTAGVTVKPITLSAQGRQGILTPGAAAVPVSTIVRPFLDLYPLPNGRDFGNGTGEYVTGVATVNHEDFVTIKTDWIAAPRLRAGVRYSFDRGKVSSTDAYKIWNTANDSRYQLVQAESTFVRSPTAIFNFRAGFSRVWNFLSYAAASDVARGLSFLPGHSVGFIRVVGLDDVGLTPNAPLSSQPRRSVLEDYQTNHEGTLLRGAHALRYGVGYDRIHLNQRADLYFDGQYRFNSITDLLAARARSADLAYPGSDGIRGYRLHQFFAFVQDEWRILPRVQLTVGVRYETYSTPTEVNGKIATFRNALTDAAPIVGGALFQNPSHLNFEPRVALAWDITGSGKTVLRAGAGIFDDLLGARDLTVAGNRMPPFFRRVAPPNPSFPNLLAAALATTPALAPETLDYYLQQPYVMQFQARIERQIGADTVVQVGYSGSRGVHLMSYVNNINPTRPQFLADGRVYFDPALPRINPVFQQIGFRSSNADSNYHSLLVLVRRRLRAGLQFQTKYGWSKSIDDNSTVVNSDYTSSGGMPQVYNFRANRGPSDFDLRHDFAASFLWQIPGPHQPRVRAVLGGWSLSGLMQAQSGRLFSPTVGFDRAHLLSTNDDGQRPNALGVPAGNLILGTVDRWFDANAFGLPADGFLGNLGRNTLTGPSLVSLDTSLQKDLFHTEKHTLRLRGEAYNLTNHPNFAIPSSLGVFDGQGRTLASAGRITSTTTTSRQLQLSLRWSF